MKSFNELASARIPYITHASWSHDGRMLAATCGDGVWLWRDDFGDAPTARLTHVAPIKYAAFNADGRQLVLASSDASVYVLETGLAFHPQITVHPLLNFPPRPVEEGEQQGWGMKRLRGHTSAVNAAVFSPDGRWIASGGGDGVIRIHDAKSGEAAKSPGKHDREVTGICWNKDRLISAGWDSALRMWDMKTNAELMTLHTDDWIREITSAETTVSSTSPMMLREHAEIGQRACLTAAALKDGSVRVFGLTDDQALSLLNLTAHDGGADAVAFSPRGDAIATGGRDGALRLWSVADGHLIAEISAHAKPVLTLGFHPRGRMIVSGGGDNALRLWEIS